MLRVWVLLLLLQSLPSTLSCRKPFLPHGQPSLWGRRPSCQLDPLHVEGLHEHSLPDAPPVVASLHLACPNQLLPCLTAAGAGRQGASRASGVPRRRPRLPGPPAAVCAGGGGGVQGVGVSVVVVQSASLRPRYLWLCKGAAVQL
jgi:hypothetical protein